jgi:putative tryptophan/tyrosine transport system substrate-binding protein
MPCLEPWGQAVRRREFLSLVCVATAWPLAVRAQQQAMPVVGYLSTGTPESDAEYLVAFRQGLRETDYIEGQNVAIEYRWAEFQNDRLPAMAADLVRRSVTVMATIGGTPPALAAKAATSTIPVIFYSGVDPVQFGLVASLNRPGGNLTGIAALQGGLVAKRLELLHETAPKASVLALLVNPTNRYTETEAKIFYESARSLGLELYVVPASTVDDIDKSFGQFAELGAGALLVSADLFLHGQRKQIVALAAKHSLPTIYAWREDVTVGGMMSYGPSLFEANRLIGVYSGKILKGAKAADLPVEQQTKVEFVINLKTAKTLGVTFSLPLVGRADEVIE